MPYKTIELPVGMTYGRLTTISEPVLRPRKDGRNRSWVACRCECGTEREFTAQNLFTGNSTSCGCYHKELVSARMTTHGATAKRKTSTPRVSKSGVVEVAKPRRESVKHKYDTRLYSIWKGMKQRCLNTNAHNYRWYGGKGVRVCNEWLEFKDFAEWAVMAGYDTGLELDRINSGGNYEPGNCRWITKVNNLRNRHRFIPDYLQDRLSDYAKEHGYTVAAVIVEALEAYLPSTSGGDA